MIKQNHIINSRPINVKGTPLFLRGQDFHDYSGMSFDEN